jgi:hypothetical protein
MNIRVIYIRVMNHTARVENEVVGVGASIIWQAINFARVKSVISVTESSERNEERRVA